MKCFNWISIDSVSPPEKQSILLRDKWNKVSTGFMKKSGTADGSDAYFNYSCDGAPSSNMVCHYYFRHGVTHWMPLPEVESTDVFE